MVINKCGEFVQGWWTSGLYWGKIKTEGKLEASHSLHLIAADSIVLTFSVFYFFNFLIKSDLECKFVVFDLRLHIVELDYLLRRYRL